VKSKRKRSTIFKGGMLVFAMAAAGALLRPTWTPGIAGPESISELKSVNINGTEQEILIRGTDRRNPILLMVHGGPGSSLIPIARPYQSELEKSFTIVDYDQRGTGKSYHPLEDYSDLTTNQLVADLLTLTDMLTREFGQPKVLLAGHSFGTYIGMKAAAAAPDKFYAYIGISQISDLVRSDMDSLAYLIGQAEQDGDESEAARLRTLAKAISKGKTELSMSLIRNAGGAARQIDDQLDYAEGFLWSPEYNLLDGVRAYLGHRVSNRRLLDEAAAHPLPDLVKQVKLPVFFAMGQHDLITSVPAALHYFNQLKAPRKVFMVFKKSAHYPQLEENVRFAEWMNEVWASLR